MAKLSNFQSPPPKHFLPKFLFHLLCFISLLPPVSGFAQRTITGRVVNGTTDLPATNQEVELLTLDEGMKTESEAQTGPDGTFTFVNVKAGPQTPHFLLRVIYQGVNYNLSVIANSEKQEPVSLTIYDTTENLDNIKVSLPLMLAQAGGKSLYVQQQYLVKNETQPRKTLVSPYATFLFDTPPANRISELNVSVVGLAGIPLPQIPTPRREGGYLITYPMKPGINEVRVSYRVNFPTNQRELKHRLFHGTQATRVLILPPDLRVTGEKLQPIGKDSHTQAATYQVTDVPEGEFLNLKIDGDAPEVSDEEHSAGDGHDHEGEDDPRVVRLPNRVFKNKEIIMASFGAFFVLAIIYALRQRSQAGRRAETARKRRPDG